ncbi:prolipoprotein diacylglyceryl transferase [Candidatus Peregrinibacteria bacterium]|nr:prolipoprotein diacylglyceryl transferase [Candidatus Peregrinibacteria bacterium]
MINPVALKIGPLSIHWYGIAYVVGLSVGVWILNMLNKRQKVFKDLNQIFDFAFWIFMVGVILGGRLGYILFYNLSYYIHNPAKIIAVWEGGMSFHGGFIACAIVCYFFFKKHKINYLKAGDIILIPSALALMFTRIANFINRELYGRVIENPTFSWMGVDFGDGMLRYPSQLFQSASALAIFLILLYIFTRKPKTGVLTFSYLILYGFFRFIIEFWREPDVQVGFILKYFTMGQLLCIIMFLFGVAGICYIYRRS